MDFKFKGRTWAGNIYHRFETMCQEVDDFVTKDSVKYVENQVQTVGQSMKKLYSNVVYDFLPPVVDSKLNEGLLGTRKENGVLGTYIRSMVGINGEHGHVNERKYFVGNGNATEVGHQRQHGLSPNFPFQQHAETDFYSEDGSNICTSKNGEVVHEENVTEAESAVSSFLTSQDEKSSLDLRDRYPLPGNLGYPEDENSSVATEISNDGDRRCIFLTNCSSEKSGEDVDFRISQKDETVCNSDDISEEAKTGLSSEQDDVNAISENAKMGPEENVINKEHHVSEGANTFNEKDSSKLTSCSKEQHQIAEDSHSLQDENSSVTSSANEDSKGNIEGKLSSVMLPHDIGLGVVQVEETVCDNADPSEEAKANLSSEIPDSAVKLGISLEDNVVKDMPSVVECKSLSNDKGCLNLSLCSRERCPNFEELSNMEVENCSESSLVPTNENPKAIIWAKFPPATSVHNQDLRDFQDEGSLCDIADSSKKAEKDLSWEINGDNICMCSDLAGMENCTVMEYAVEESINSLGLKSSSDYDNLSNSSPPLSDKDHKNTVLTNFSQAKSDHDAELEAFQVDGTICNPSPSSELLSSIICVENKIAEAKVTSLNSSVSMEALNLPDISYANYTQKAKKNSCDYTDSSCVSYVSGISSGSFSYDDKAVIPPFSSRSVSTVSDGQGDDHAVNIADPDMETIDLSDHVNLDESCIIVDNGLQYSASTRPRKFRSYKKLIQDAFASRKRRIKEYEQLAIWYGDIETETCLFPKQNLFPPVTAINSSSRTSQTSDVCEAEWELL